MTALTRRPLAAHFVSRLVLVLATAATLTLATGTGTAWAHAEVVATYPSPTAPPDRLTHVSVTFDEPVELIPHALVLTNDRGIPVRLDAAQRLHGGREIRADLPDPAGAGRYAVGWRVRTDDGHIESGSFRFELGAAVAATATPAAPMGDSDEPLWPVLVALGLAVAAGIGAFVVVRRGLRALVAAGGAYPAESVSRASAQEHPASQQ